MANGDRLFGPVGASGSVTGTGADITVTLDFFPQWVELVNSVTGASMYWTKAMPAASGMVNIASGGGFTGNASGGTPSGTITDTALNTLAAHGHNLQLNSVPVVLGAGASLRIYYTPGVGVFAPADAITGAPSGATGTITAVGTSDVGVYMEYTVTAGTFASGDTITSGVKSGTADSDPLNIFTYAPTVAMFQGVYDFNTNDPYGMVVNKATLATGNVRLLQTSGEIESLLSDGITNLATVTLDIATTTTSGGTPSYVAVAGPQFAGNLLVDHNHTVAAGGGSFVAVGGITAGNSGFIIGNDPSVNILGDNINWNAGR